MFATCIIMTLLVGMFIGCNSTVIAALYLERRADVRWKNANRQPVRH